MLASIDTRATCVKTALAPTRATAAMAAIMPKVRSFLNGLDPSQDPMQWRYRAACDRHSASQAPFTSMPAYLRRNARYGQIMISSYGYDQPMGKLGEWRHSQKGRHTVGLSLVHGLVFRDVPDSLFQNKLYADVGLRVYHSTRRYRCHWASG